MRGVVAAGQQETAACAAEILRAGGNAVDAAIAAAAASFVAEPLLASAGGGGMMTVAVPGQDAAVVDFFSNAPGLGLPATPAQLDFAGVDVDFDAAIQEFHVGRGSAAVPGALPGLAIAHRQFGSMPLPELMAPAVRLARAGVPASAETAMVFRLLWDILCRDPATPLAYTRDGHRPQVGDVLVNPALADTLEQFGARGEMPAAMRDGLLAEFGPDRGGLLTATDLDSYQATVRRTLAIEFDDLTIHTTPAVGGRLVEVILRNLLGDEPNPVEPEEVRRLAAASRASHAARQGLIVPGSTTHLSVIDGDRGVAAVTLSNGEGCGHLIPGTGVQVNNFLGEEDLNPHGFHRHSPGRRLPTMMAPTVVERGEDPVLALGSGGSNRIRSAVGQVLYRTLVLEQSAEVAVQSPRVHAEGRAVWLESGGLADRDAVTAALATDYDQVYVFEGLAFFFGGVHTVAVDRDGRPHGVGDPRRGGVALVV